MKFKRILHLSIDDLRFDALSFAANKSYLKKYGFDGVPNTPNIDFFAREGIFFSRTYTTAPFTPASHASMFTGCYQPKHSLRQFLGNSLSNTVTNIFEYLKTNNFYTISAIDFKDIFELNNLLKGSHETIVRDDNKVVERLLSKKNEPVYLFMHIGDVHPPYGESFYPPDENYNESFYKDYEELAKILNIDHEPFRDNHKNINRENLVALSNKVRVYCEENFLSDVIQFPRYLNGINKFDKGRFKKFMDNLRTCNLIDLETLVIITSDHGQAIIDFEKTALSHKKKKIMKFDHGETIIEEIIRVPLMFYSPSLKLKNNTIQELTSVVDILPTILDFLEIKAKNLDGISLKPLILGENMPILEKRSIYAEAWFHDRKELSSYLKKASKAGSLPKDSYHTFLFQQAVVKNHHKLVRTNQTEDSKEINDKLYNISGDPYESFDLLRTLKAPRYVKSWDLTRPIYDDLTNELNRYDLQNIVTISQDPHSVYKTEEEIKLIEERLTALGYIE